VVSFVQKNKKLGKVRGNPRNPATSDTYKTEKNYDLADVTIGNMEVS